MERRVQSILVASHNIMHGLRLPQLVATYRSLATTLDLGVLCLQENRVAGEATPAELIGRALGEGFEVICRGENAQLAVIFDHRRVSVREELIIPLPKLKVLGKLAHLYMAEAEPEQKYALVCTVTPHGGAPFTLVNFHLDAAGSNHHREEQLAAVSTTLVARDLHHRLIAVGDANVFTLRHKKHREAYEALLAPLTELGAVDPETRPTHFFSRSREPKIAQRLARAIGKLRLDLPRRYDVICSNLAPLARGQVATPDSDHDLLWGRFDVSATTEQREEVRQWA